MQLGRGPLEPCDGSFSEFYSQIRRVTKTVKSEEGPWELCLAEGWSDNETAKNLLSWCWEGPGGRFLVVINFAGTSSQGRIRLPWANLAGKQWRLSSLLGSDVFDRNGNELWNDGFYVGLEPWQYYVLRFAEKMS